MTLKPLLVLPSLLLAILAGCSQDQPPKSPDDTNSATATADIGANASLSTSPPPANSAASTTGSGTTATSAPTNPPPDTTVALSDDQILQVTHTANQGEIEQAQLAQTKAKDPRVKKLAAMMIKDHTDADNKGMALVKKANLTPAPSPVSTSLQSDAQSATTALKSQSGADFDKGYVDTQVKEHQAVLDTIDQKLLPNAKNADVKAYLAEVRPKIAMHLQHAQDLQKEMQK